MIDQWIPVAVFMGASLIVGFTMIVGAWLLAVRAKNPPATRYLTYECGEDPQGSAWMRFHPRYYVVALVFVLFDVEAVFLFPWALSFRDLGLFAVVEMFIFVGILLLGWAYALRKGALKWQ